MEQFLVGAVGVLSMPGIFVVGAVPAAMGFGMAGLLLVGLIDGQYGGRLSGEEGEAKGAGAEKGRRAA